MSKKKIHIKEDTINSEEASPINSSKTDGAKTEHFAKKKKFSLKIILAAVIVLVVIICGAYYYYNMTHFVSTDDAFITGRPVYITPNISDYVSKVHVISDQHVEKGDLLVEIDPRNYELKIDEAEANIDITKAKLNAAIATYKIAIDAQNTAAIDMNRNQILMAGTTEGAAISQEDFEHSISLYEASISEVNFTKAGILLGRAELDKAMVALDHAKLIYSYTKIYAPVSGYITKRNVEPGSLLAQGNPIMAIVSDTKWIVANFKETQLSNIRIGQEVNIYIDAYPCIAFKGHVKGIQAGTGDVFSLLPPENATGNFVKVVQRVPVEIVFDNIPDQSKYFISLGMSVEPIIKIK